MDVKERVLLELNPINKVLKELKEIKELLRVIADNSANERTGESESIK